MTCAHQPLMREQTKTATTSVAVAESTVAHGDGNGNAKVIWKFDMIKELGVWPRNQANSSPVSFGDLVIASTANPSFQIQGLPGLFCSTRSGAGTRAAAVGPVATSPCSRLSISMNCLLSSSQLFFGGRGPS